MKIQKEEDALFAEWKLARPGFVADGVADENEFTKSGRRLLFVLKEVNDPDGGDWDLRQYMREGGRSHTWDNITRWVEGIRSLPAETPWNQLESIDHERRLRALRSIAAVNIKKSPGSHTSDAAQVAIVAGQDRTFLNRQVSLYDADLIICCGVSDTFHWLVDLGASPQWKMTSRGVYFHKYRPNKFVVSFAHPEARIANSLLYYGLTDAIREITHEFTTVRLNE